MKPRLISPVVILLALLAASCAPQAVALPEDTPTPEVQTVEVTIEVTRLVEVPVTSTPTLTPTLAQTYTPTVSPTITRTPSRTPTLQPPQVSILEHSICMYGPGTVYLPKYGLNATVRMRVIGRNEDGSWLALKAGNDPDSNACWLKTSQVEFLSGDIRNVPVLWIVLPHSLPAYHPPAVYSASREGNEVTISWQPIWMTEDDYRGYLVETWVCQGGKQVFVPLGYVTNYLDNLSGNVVSVKVTDEPGCNVPSRARLYAVEKHGYTNYVMVPWPGFDPAPTATP